jgi:RHS repeat-associated protein
VAGVENNLSFAGQYFDSETGLHYNYWRYYDPKLGRYLRTDPIGLRGGINLYSYVKSNPINFFDPKGLVDAGIGYYWGGGAEVFYGHSTCCENNIQFRIKLLTVCGGAGAGVRGALPVSVTAGGVSSKTGCPRTRYYFKHETTFVYHAANVQGDSQGASAGIDAGIYGMATIWVFCSDTVISRTKIGCCD